MTLFKHTKPYLRVFFILSLVITSISFLIFWSLFYTSKAKLENSTLDSGKKESREIGKMLELQLSQGLPKDMVIQNLQASIANTDTQRSFICMYNANGIELCHPDPSLIGQKIDDENSSFYTNGVHSRFSDVLKAQKADAGLRVFPEFKKRDSQIVSVYPVKGTNWMVASHTNEAFAQSELLSLFQSFFIAYISSMLLIIFVCYWIIKKIYGRYESENQNRINNLNEDILNLSNLNLQLVEHQKNTKQNTVVTGKNEMATPISRKRITAYFKDQLLSIEVTEIAYFYLDNGVVYLQLFKDSKYVINFSLDELDKTLDSDFFFRVNRQFIVNIQAIKSILLYGKNQLKLTVTPAYEQDILISKNKVAEFKKWLDQ